MKIRLLFGACIIALLSSASYAHNNQSYDDYSYYNDHYHQDDYSPYNTTVIWRDNYYNNYDYDNIYPYDSYYDQYDNHRYWYSSDYDYHIHDLPSKPANSRWVTGCEIASQLCEWVCDDGYRRSGNTCIYDRYINTSYSNNDYFYGNTYSYYDDRYSDSYYSNSWYDDYDRCELETTCGYKYGTYSYYGSECSARDDGATIVSLSKCKNNYDDTSGYYSDYRINNDYYYDSGYSDYYRDEYYYYDDDNDDDTKYYYYNQSTNYNDIHIDINNANDTNQTNTQTNDQYNYNYQDNHNYNYNCDNGTTNYPYCTTCPVGETYIGGHCVTKTRCDSLPANAYWYGGNGDYEPNCQWRCRSGYQQVGNVCVQEHCSNGATNYPNCNFCPHGQTYNNGQCTYQQSCPIKPTYSTWRYGHGNKQPNCEWDCNSGYTRSGNACIQQICNNGTTNYPYCNICPAGTQLHNNQCVHKTYNWYTSSYSSCSVSCGGGTKTRTVECRDNYGNHVSDGLCYGQKPSSTELCNTHTCQSSINGQCGTSVDTCYQGTYQSKNSTGNTHYWQCNGLYGGADAHCSKTINASVNGVCGSSQNSCIHGTFVDQNDTSGYYKWACNGTYGGSNAYCSIQKQNPTNGVCGSSQNSCIHGTFQDQTDTNSQYKWQCIGTQGGSSAYCSIQKQNPINGQCGSVINNCITGQFIDQNDTSYNYKWRCAGVDGGVTRDCTITKEQYSWYIGDYGSCSQTCGGGTKTKQVYCQDSNGYKVSDSLCSGTKPSGGTTSCNTQGCLMWVNTDGYSSCNTVCSNAGKNWVKNKHGESCASGMNRPTGVHTINYKYGTWGSAGLGGSVVYNYYNECYHCYKEGQKREHNKENWVVACLCQ